MVDYQAFAERTKDIPFDELVHEGKKEAQRLLEDQGVTAMALYISEMMAHALEMSSQEMVVEESERAVS